MIIKAKSAGYCFGVNKAVNTAYEASENSEGRVYTLGPLIHNAFVTDGLRKKGVEIISDLDEIEEGTVIIRSHGVGKSIYDKIEQKGLKLIDATCPYVKSIQNKVEKYHNKGYTIIIVGDRNHPEVKGVNGWCENSATVVFTTGEAEKFHTENDVCVVAQTTIIEALFDDITRIIEKNCKNVKIFNTICNATSVRQDEASEIASRVDAMVVVGDTHSSNTKKLVEISRANCENVFFVENALELTDAINKYDNIGLTAGASTPTQLIEEVINTMENSMVDSFEKNIEESMKQIREGDIIEGEIVAVDHNEVVVNIGYKSDGIVKKADYLYDLMEDLTTKAAKGDKVKVMVTKMNDGTGNVALSKIKVDEMQAFEEAREKYESAETVKAKIIKVVKGGLICDLGFIKAFMPASYYDVRFIKDFEPLLGKEVDCRIVEFDRRKNKIIVSRKILLQEAYKARKAKEKERKENAIAALEIGKVVEAPIKNITSFGMFIDLNGVDGFIHISDIAWRRVNKISDLYNVGDVVNAVVTELDKENYKVKLSIKNLTKEPWQQFIETYSVGQVVKATIKNTTKFGAFAEIIPDVEGLIHISQLSYERVNKVEDAVKTGDEVNVKIIDINNDKRKISLSIKETMTPPKRKIERNKVAHKEDGSMTLGDLFGDLLTK